MSQTRSDLSVAVFRRNLSANGASSVFLASLLYSTISLRLEVVMRDADVYRLGSIGLQPQNGERLSFIEQSFFRPLEARHTNACRYSTARGCVQQYA